MRVVIATTTAFHLRHLARELIAQGHDVTFVSILPKWKTRGYGLPDAACVSLFARLQPWAGLAVLRLPWIWLDRVRDRLAARVDRAIARTAPACDVFIGLSSVTVASAAAARAKGARVLIERGASHIDTQAASATAAGAAPPSPLYVAREHASYRAADVVVVPSRFVAATFAAAGFPAERVRVTPLGVDLSAFPMPATPAPAPVSAIFVGGWTRRKGCDLFAGLLDRLPDLRLTHVGLPGDVAFPDNPRFRTLGYLGHAVLAGELPRHHLFVFPSRDDGFGMVMAEAIACGLRVVASTASGAPDLQATLGDAIVTVVAPDDLDALAAAVAGQMRATAADPAAARPTAEQRTRLSWAGYGIAYSAMLGDLVAA